MSACCCSGLSTYIRLAAILDLPEKDGHDTQRIIDGVRQWLNNALGWLLVVDNVDDANMLEDVLTQEGQGHVLLTARDPEVGTRTTTNFVAKMERGDGAALLLRRAGIIPEQGWLSAASSYEREKALAIADILRMCAFLQPDAIPEEYFTSGDVTLPEPFRPVAADAYSLAQAMGALVRYSFIQRRNEDRTVGVHRLVQDVITDQMSDYIRFDWVRHVIWIVEQTLPRLERETWKQYQRYIAHAVLALQLIEEWQIFQVSTIGLMIHVGAYLFEIAAYKRAEPICLRALQLAQLLVEPEHLLVILALHNVAMFYERWGDYQLAESYYQQAISACSKSTEPIELTTTNMPSHCSSAHWLSERSGRKRTCTLWPNA
jgi:tetratricopeptide (TPR) repeat protein